jgi:hypothetical protein
MTIFQLNVPHQKAPSCWTAHNQDDYVLATIRSNVASDWDVEDPTFDQAVDRNGHDMSSAYVFLDANDAARELINGERVGLHQFAKAIDALRTRVMRHLDEITDEQIALQLAGQIFVEARADEREASEALYTAIKHAHRAGISEVQISKLATVDRMTVRRALGKR